MLLPALSPTDTASLIDSNTEFVIVCVLENGTLKGFPGVSYEDIGGLKNEVQKVREMIELPLVVISGDI